MSGKTEVGNVKRRRSPAADLVAIASAVSASTLWASPAFAHASDRGHVLLLPTGHYLVGGALAVAASFVVLALLPPRTLGRITTFRLDLGPAPDRLRLATSLAGFVLFVVLVAAGLFGSRDPLSNPLPLVVWTLLWVGMTLVQGLLGDVWRWIDPWYGPWRLALMAGRGRLGRRRFSEAVGYWPALALFLAFAWFELIYPAPDDPARLAVVAGSYWLVSFLLMLIFGHADWSRRGEFLSVFFGMIAKFGIFGRRHGRLQLRLAGAGLADEPALQLSGVLFILAALGSVSFDGLSKTFFWLGANGINPLEYPGRTALMTVNGFGLVMTIVVLAAAYFGAIVLGHRLAGSASSCRTAAGLLVWSIVPIALAYHFSHYLTALLVNSQYALVAISDPFARGWNLFGTAYLPVSAGIAAGSDAAWMLWNAQATVIIGGHVLAVLVAHGLAFRLEGDARRAALGQLPLTALMILYTVFGLWLLSTPAAG